MGAEENLLEKSEIETILRDAPSSIPAKRKVDRSLIRSLAWNAAGDWGTQIFSWAAFLIIVRLLNPSDFGLLAMAGTIGPFVQYFSGNGIPRAIVTFRDLTEQQLAQLNSFGLLLGTFSYSLAVLLAKPVAMFYHTPRLTLIVTVSSIGLIFNGAQAVSNGLLLKQMRFREISMFNAVGGAVTSVLTLLFALLGWGYWALIFGGYPGGILRLVLVMKTRRQTYAIPHWSSIKEVVKFAIYVVLSLFALSIYENLDNLTAGKVFGKTELGLYSMAWTLAYVPLDKVTSLVTMVIPSYFAAFQKDMAAARRSLANLSEGIALLMFPSCVGLGIVAHDFVPIVLGSKWEGTAGPLQVLAIYAAIRSVVALLPRVLTALGYARFVMWNDIAAIVILGLGFYTGSHWGITGIAWGWVVCYPVVAARLYRKTFATIGMTVKEYVGRLRPALEGTAVMILAVECVHYALAGNASLRLRLTAQVATGALFYSGTLWLRHRQRILAFIEVLKSACRR